jgi:YVTN family beta-propeller protein
MVYLSKRLWTFESGLVLGIAALTANAAPFAYIPNAGSNNVSVIDTALNIVTATVPVGSFPFGIAVNPAGTFAYVSNLNTNTVSVINTATNIVTATVPVGNSPGGVAVNPAGTFAYVSNLDTNTVSVINTATNTVVATVPVGTTPYGIIAVNPAGTFVYVANYNSANVSVINTSTNTVVATVPVGPYPRSVAVNPAGTFAYVPTEGSNNVAVINTATNTVVSNVPVGSGVRGIAFNPAGTFAYVANYDSNNVSVIDTAANTVVATVPVGTSPAGVAINAAGTFAYVANQNSNNVSVINTATNTVVATVPVGTAPLAFGNFIGPSTVKTYSDNGNGTVTDSTTGLMWMRCSMGQTWTGSTCSGTVSSYTWDQANALTGTVSFAGNSDWRLPNVRELATIVDRTTYGPAINAVAFPNTNTSSDFSFGSASAYAINSSYVWYVYFGGGVVGDYVKNSGYQVRLVRAGQSLGLLNLARPTSDYVDHADGTVTHTPTSLMWKRCAEGQNWSGGGCSGSASTFTWDAAKLLTSTFAGNSDWRLPTSEELATLVDYTAATAPAINTTLFPNTSSSYFWSASAYAGTYAGSSSYAWPVYFYDGVVTNDFKYNAYQVRLVRAGQSLGSLVAPGAPTIGTATPGNASATVSFTAPTNNGGGVITGYTANCGGVTAAGGASPITVTGLTNGNAYTCTVTAINAVGTSAASAASNSVTPGAPVAVPGAPTGIGATAGNASATVSFTAPTNTGGGAITGYTANCGGFTAGGSVSPITVTGLTNGTAYTCTVTATNAVGTSAASAASNSVTPVAPSSLPGAPTGIAATAGNGRATVSFAAPTSTGGSAITGYTANCGGVTATGSASPITVTGLINGIPYTCTVTATNASGTGAASAASNSVTPVAPVAVPGAPTGIGATAGNASATVSFTAPANTGGGTLSYTVTSSPGGFVASGSASPITVVGLVNGVAYTFTVTATNSAGTSSASAASNAITPGAATAVPGVPTNVSAVAGNGSILISFIAPTSTGSSLITGYAATCNPDNIKAIGTASPITVTGITNGTAYTCTVSASNSAGASLESAPVSATPAGQASASLSTTTLSFGVLGIGATSVSQSVTLTNTGNSVLTISSIDVTGDFAKATLCGSTLAGGGSCLILLTFKPTASGTRTGTLTITSSAAGAALSVSLNGTGSSTLPRLSALTLTGAALSPTFDAGVTSYGATFPSTATSVTVTASAVDTTSSIRVNGTLASSSGTTVPLAFGLNTITVRVTASDGVTSNDYTIGVTRMAPMLAGGAFHTLALKDDGTLWAWGFNYYGQLGDGTTTDIKRPKPIGSGYMAVVAGNNYTLGLKSDGSLWTWGANDYGQLGDATTVNNPTPKKIASGYTAVTAGNYHSLALATDGSLWAWGNNDFGQLGDGTVVEQHAPKRIGKGYVAIAAGLGHTLALKQDGSLWAWGQNSQGQLGDGRSANSYDPELVGTGYKAVSAAGNHSMALKTDGSLWTWGANDYGQLGDGTTTPSAIPKLIGAGYASIAAGFRHNLALKTDGSLWAWGSNGHGQLGDGTVADSLTPKQIDTGFSALTAGRDYTVALKNEGTVWALGANWYGQLGDGTLAQRRSTALVVNDTVDGPLDLIPAAPKNIPANKILPFFSLVSSDSTVVGSRATVKNTTTFNPAHVGKQGAVFVTARVPAGSLVPAQTASALSASGVGVASSALTAAKPFDLIQLTPTGWQPIVNGQLIPYASGVLGDLLSAQTILSNTDTANLQGAEICLGYGTNADEMAAAGRVRTVATILDPNVTNADTASCIAQLRDIRSYIPAANASAGYRSFLRVINTGSSATPLSVAVIDGATGAVGASGQLLASLPAGAAVTFTAQQVEAALGAPLPASDRSRIRVTASSAIEVQSFMSNPGGVVTQISDALTASTGYAVRSYVPAANTPAGYTSFIRVINVGTTASPIVATVIDDTTGAAGASGILIASLPAGAAATFTAQQIEAALGVSLNASSRPRISIASVSVPSAPLEVQSFIANPGGTVTQIGSAQSGTAVVVRSFIPAAMAASGYTGFIRVINTGTTATPINVSLLDGTTGQASTSGQLMSSLPAGAAKTFTAQQVETALGLTLPSSARPRIQLTASTSVDVQSFMSNPGGTVTQIVGAQSGSSVDVRTYIPAANAAGSYTSFIRIINTGTTATPITVAVIDGAVGAVGTSGQLTASLPAGAAVTYTAQQVEAALGAPLPAGDRSRIRVTASASTLDVQSFMANPGGVITETADFQ